LFNHIAEIDCKLTALQPPNYIKRAPRPIETHLKLYKSSEFKNWFFYFSIPVLYGIMPQDQLQHYFLLVHAFYLLSQNSISLVDVEKARELIKKFVKKFETSYGERFMSSNIHSLLHMCDNVLELGPLFVTSCFPLEDLNGKMKSLVCGSRYAEVKIAESFYTLQNLPRYVSELKSNSQASNFIQDIKSNNLALLERIDCSTFTIGKYMLLAEIPYVIQEAFANINYALENTKCWLFHRLHKNKVLYVAHGYTRLIKSISYCIEYDNNIIGLLESFIKITKCACNISICPCPAEFFGIVNKCFWVEINGIGENNFINELLPTDSYIAIPHTNLLGLCVVSKVNDVLFCAKRVNNIEME
jgi:hypothetical protein